MIASLWIALVNRLLAREEWARARLSPFSGRSLRVEAPAGRGFTVTIDPQGLLAAADAPPEGAGAGGPVADATAGGPVPEASADGQATDAAPDTTVAFGALLRAMAGPPAEGIPAVQGDPEMAAAVTFVAGHLRWDAEEDLARVFGDIAANRMVRLARGARALQRDAAGRLAASAIDYLTEEKRVLTSRPAFDGFAAEVKALSAATEALAERIAALEAKRSA